MKIKINKRVTKISIILILLAISKASAATYPLSNETGDFKDRMISAQNKAISGDTILIDMDFTVSRSFTISKQGLTVDGTGTLTNDGTDDRTLSINVSDTTFKNLTFVGGVRAIKVTSANTLSNLVFENLTILNGTFHGIGIFDTDIDNVTITGCTFTESPYSVLMMDCPTMTNIYINNNTFNGSNHQISLDCAELDENLNHSNIRIENNTFNETLNFNVALANMKAGLVKSNVMAGGTNSYSQCVHVEDRTRNAYIKMNTMINEGDPGSDAVLVYSTDRFGHGTGELLTYQEKLAYASGPISFEANTINGAGRSSVILQFLSGNANFYGSNLLLADGYGIQIWTNEVDVSQLFIGDPTTFNDNYTWADIKNLDPSQRSDFVNF